MKSLHDYIAEVTAKDKAVPTKAQPKSKKKSNPYNDANHAMSHDEEKRSGTNNEN
jgi:hypothetical protein